MHVTPCMLKLHEIIESIVNEEDFSEDIKLRLIDCFSKDLI